MVEAEANLGCLGRLIELGFIRLTTVHRAEQYAGPTTVRLGELFGYLVDLSAVKCRPIRLRAKGPLRIFLKVTFVAARSIFA